MLVGRSHELERIDALMAAARDGRAGALVVRGEPGIGKTALLEQAVARAAGFRVLGAAGVESEAELACAGLYALLRPVLACLEALPPPQAAAMRAALALGPAGAADRFAVYAGTLGLLAAAGEETPVLCVVDDAHWLDALSADALLFAARRLAAERVAILFAARTGDRPFPAPHVPEIELGSLDETAARALVAAGPAPVPDLAADALLRVAGGNPLALLELPRTLTAGQLLAAGSSPEPVRVSQALEVAFAGRVRGLSVDARRALVLAAAGGGLAGLGSLVHDAALTVALEEAERAGLVRLEDGVVAFRHPLVRAAAYQTATAGERRRAHAALAAAMPDGARDERVWHLAASTVGEDDGVAAELDGVAERAGRRGATSARARALARAAALTTGRAARCRRLLDAAQAAYDAGHGAWAKTLVDEAEGLADDERELADAAYVRWLSEADRWVELYPSLLAAVDAVAPVDRRRAARMLSASSDYLFCAGRIEESVPVSLRAWALLDEQLVPGLLGVPTDVAWVRLYEGRAQEAADLAMAVLDLGLVSDGGDDFDLGFAAEVLVYAEDPRARGTIDALVERTRSRGILPALCLALGARAQLELWHGRLDDAHAAALESFALGEVLGSWPAVVGPMMLAMVEGALGRREACAEHAALSAEVAPPGLDFLRAYALGGLALAALARGELETARRELEETIRLRPASHVDWPGLPSRTDLAEVLIRLGEPEQALSLVAAFERAQAGRPLSLATAHRCRLLAAADDALDGVARDAITAIEGRSPFEEARTRLVYGERLRRAGRRVDARRELERARELFAGLGAEAWAVRAEDELGASAARIRSPGPELDVLTAQELRVARAVAEGKSNRQVGAELFISPKTVEVHLSRVYRKLGITSRLQLARLDAVDPGALVDR